MTSLASQSTASGRKRKSTTTSREMSIQIPWPDPIVYSEHELKLIRGTYELMGRVGAQQLTLRYTARELGVSPGLLKYHFGDQDRLLIETMRWALQDALRRARHSLEGLTDPKAALSALLDEVFLNPKRFRELELVSLDLAQYVARHPEFTEFAALVNTQSLLYTAIIEAGVDSGAFDVDDVEVAVFQVRALVMGCGQQWIQHADWATSLQELRNNCQQAIFTILKAAGTSS